MIDPSEIVDNLVELLRDIPDLVAEMNDDPQRIYAYHDLAPAKNVSLAEAKYRMEAPSMMVSWVGTGPGSFGAGEVWKHDIAVTMRASGRPYSEDTQRAYYQLFRLLTKGTPASGDQPMNNTTVHASCQPMDTPFIRRETDDMGIDYFEAILTFTEIGDD